MAIPKKTEEVLVAKIRSLPKDKVSEVEDFVDFLQQRAKAGDAKAKRQPFDFPVISVGPWPRDLSLRREDMYGDDGR